MISKIAVAIYFCCAWSLVIFFCWTVQKSLRHGLVQLKRLHQIPCSRCAFFTNNYRLKCTVNPTIALSEEAIGCKDFELGSSNSTLPRHKKCDKTSSCLAASCGSH